MTDNTANAQDPSLVRAVGEIGDAWTMLITWAIASGVTRFDALQRELGVARNILSERLRKQMANGVIEKRPIADGARRMEYRLTEKGRALSEALCALRDWAQKWGPAGERMLDAAPNPVVSAPRRLTIAASNDRPEARGGGGGAEAGGRQVGKPD